MIKGIIFDFDGVIVESVSVKTDAFAELYSKYNDDTNNSQYLLCNPSTNVDTADMYIITKKKNKLYIPMYLWDT